MSTHFPGKSFVSYSKIDTSKLQELTNQDIIIEKTVQLRVIPRDEVNSQFSFQTHGFQYLTALQHEGLLSAINAMTRVTEHKQSRQQLREAVRDAMNIWAHQKGIPFTHVVAVDAVYRSGNKEVFQMFKPINFAHVDFQNSSSRMLESFKNTWKQRVQAEIETKLTDQEYINLKVTKMINVWFPLNKNATRNTLAIMDSSNASVKLVPYTAVRKDGSFFTAQTVPFESSQEWVASNIKRGDAIVFDSRKVPHSALNLSQKQAQFMEVSNQQRVSVQVRCLFLQHEFNNSQAK